MSRAAFWSQLDRVGLLLAAGGIVWTQFAAASSGGSGGPFTALLLVSMSALVIGRLTASVHRSLPPAALVGAAAVLAITTPDVMSSAPLSGPFSYANAKGAFFLQAGIAGLMLSATSRATPARMLGVAAAIAFGVVPFASDVLTAAVLVVLLPVVALTVYALAGARTAVIGCAVLFIVTLATTTVLGSTYAAGGRSGLVDRVVDSTLTERRAALWHEALVMMGRQPVTGVGPGGFQVFSPTARLDRDARWAHNSFLQQGAETGLAGLILLVLLFLWGFGRLGAAANADSVSVLGAVAVAALAIHACVDYILHFPAVPVATAALVGAAVAPPDQRAPRESSESSGP